MKKSKNYTAEEKVIILREHLDNKVHMSDLSEKYGINPSVIYLWKKQLFENASILFERKTNKKEREAVEAQEKINQLQDTLSVRESLISELVIEMIDLKKKENGEVFAKSGLNRKSGTKS